MSHTQSCSTDSVLCHVRALLCSIDAHKVCAWYISIYLILIGGERERAPHLIVRSAEVCLYISLSVLADWARKYNVFSVWSVCAKMTYFPLYHAPLSFNCACSNDHSHDTELKPDESQSTVKENSGRKPCHNTMKINR